MKISWAQPSLSRDFALLSAAILFIMFLMSAWVTYVTYARHSERIAGELEKEATRIESTLAKEMDSANYMLTALGRQIVLDQSRDLVRLAQVLKSFDSKGYIYSIFSWVSADQHVVVSSNRGVLDKPVDISDRDYVKKALAEPWKMHIGRPIEGRVSGRWVIPVSMGLTDYTGKFIGTIMVSIDINTLTEQLSMLVKRDGISFAIVSKTLIPLTQVSDDKDFVTNNFPTQKLVNVNFTANPSGLISEGSKFWGTGSYSYYRVSEDYPYIILLGYDAHFSDEAVSGQLWPRLGQIFGIAAFFVLFLWIMSTRMVRPVLDMTAIAAAVAKGEPYTALPHGGPVEIASLAAQIRKISEYMEETKRIEDELRNKMFMLKRSKERAEMDQRNKSEALAYICQEMYNPLTNIIGFAQVMKDQLYGPIENRKYRQYSTDIYQASNNLLSTLQTLLVLAKAETDYIELSEKPVDVPLAVSKALQFIADKMQAENISSKTKFAEPLPRLFADEFRLQQILTNLLVHATRHTLPGHTLMVEAKSMGENKEKAFFAIIITTSEQLLPTAEELSTLAERIMYTIIYPVTPKPSSSVKEPLDLGLELARTLVALHRGALDISKLSDGGMVITLLFSANRIRFVEEKD